MVDLFVTYLEMTAPSAGEALVVPCDGAAIARERLVPEPYLALYRAVGGPMDWDERLRLPPATLRRLLADPAMHLYILRRDGEAAGLCEFVGVGGADIELANFGLVPAAQGRRLGPFLLNHALRAVWRHRPKRIWLHTDTNDHPKAIATYQRAGFRIYDRRMECFPD